MAFVPRFAFAEGAADKIGYWRIAMTMRRCFVFAAMTTFCMTGLAHAGDPPSIVDVGWAKDAGKTRVQLQRVVKAGAWAAWSPHWHIFVNFEGAESDDMLVLQHFKGKKKWGKEVKCRMKKAPSSYSDGLAYFDCMDKDNYQQKKAGAFSTQVTYKAVGEGKTYENVRELKYNVVGFKSDNMKKPSPGWVVDNDWRLGDATISMHRNEPHRASVELWFKSDRNNRPKPKMRCYHGETKIDTGDRPRKQLETEYRFYKKDKDTTIVWQQYRFSLTKLWYDGDPDGEPDVHVLDKNPGDYKCTVTNDGDIVKTVSFKVGDDGKIVQSKCAAVPEKKYTFVKVESAKGADYKYAAKAYAKSAYWGAGGCDF